MKDVTLGMKEFEWIEEFNDLFYPGWREHGHLIYLRTRWPEKRGRWKSVLTFSFIFVWSSPGWAKDHINSPALLSGR